MEISRKTQQTLQPLWEGIQEIAPEYVALRRAEPTGWKQTRTYLE